MTATRAAVPVPHWASHALVAATAWLVLLGTLVPVVAPSLGAWLPAHEHQTLTAFVPPHTHVYERAANAPSGAACEETPHSHTSPQDAHVVCTTGDDLITGVLSVIAPEPPAILPAVPALSSTRALDDTGAPLDPGVAVRTPPPRA